MQTALEVSVKKAYNRLTQEAGKITLLDVREDMEVALCHIKGSIHIPLHRLESTLEHLSKETSLLIYCHHGRRSLLAANYLTSKGFNAKSIQGGIHAWTDQIDPSLQRY